MTARDPRLRLALCGSGLAIGLAGELLFATPRRAALLVLAFGAAAVLVLLGAGLPAREPEPEPLPPAERPPKGARLLALGGAVGSAVLALLAWRAFAEAPSGKAWLLFAASVALLLAGVSRWGGTRRGRPRPSRAELAGLVLVVGAAAAFRLHLLGSEPHGVWFDEAQNAIEAKKILDDPGYRPVFVSGLSQMPALSFYYFAPFVKAVGARVLAVRLATTLVGLLAVVFVWLLGRELYGPDVGLVAAGFLAACRWHVDFSRFGMAIVFPTLFVPAALFFFARSQRTLSPRDAVLGGVVLGIGMQTYYAMFAVPLLLGLAFAHAFVTDRSRRSAAAAGLLALLLASAFVTYLPVFQYARTHRDEFSERMRTVSAVQAGSMGELARILLTPSPRRDAAREVIGRNAYAHALMFHVAGDRNGRHNLPGAPMLDPVTGVFFAVGLLLALAHLFDARAALLLLWFGAMLSAGVLSLDFEAPQGARTCGIVSVVALLAAIPLARVAALVPGRAAAFSAAVPLAVAFVLSWRTYFGPQLHHPKVFLEFSAVDTKIGEVARDEGKTSVLYAPLTHIDLPTQLLLAGGPTHARPFERWRDLPLETRGRPAVVFVEPAEVDTLETLRALYPHANVEPLAARLEDGSSAPPLLRTVRVPVADIEALSGLEVTFTSPRGEAATARVREAALDASRVPWPPPFTAELRGVLRIASSGAYAFGADGGARVDVRIDGEPAPAGVALHLARGSHALAATFPVTAAAPAGRLVWSTGGGPPKPIPPDRLYLPTVPTSGLLGRYYRGGSCEGVPAYEQIDPQILFTFYGIGPSRPFAACWSGSLFAAETGTYLVGTSSSAESAVSIDDRPVVDNRAAFDYVDSEVPLARGWHAIRISYVGTGGYPHLELRWKTPSGALSYAPSSVLAPPPPGRAPAPKEPKR